MRQSHQARRGSSILASLISAAFAVSACVQEDARNSLALTDPNAVPSPVPGNPSCGAVMDTQTITGRYVVSNLNTRNCAETTICIDPSFWQTLNTATFIPGIDVVILFDTTQSMQPYINAVKSNLSQLITNLSTMTPSLRLGLAQYKDFAGYGGDMTDLPYAPIQPLTTDLAAVQASLATLTASGGGDFPESLSTALRAISDGKPYTPYFGPFNMGFDPDPARVKIVLVVSDASDKKVNLPNGAATMSDAITALKLRGILVMGIALRPPLGETRQAVLDWYAENASWNDLNQIAADTGAIVKAPGVDLNGDGDTAEYGEIAAGQPAVLTMDQAGNLAGAPSGSNPTQILADAIAEMVKQVRPFQFSLTTTSAGRAHSPAVNTISISPSVTTQQCFAVTRIDPVAVPAACPELSQVVQSAREESTGTDVDGRYLIPSLQFGCGQLPPPDWGIGI